LKNISFNVIFYTFIYIKIAELVRTYYDKEHTKLKEEYFVRYGMKNGEYKKYDEDGQLWDICMYKDGMKNGKFKTYYENGQLRIMCSYTNNIEDGEYNSYYENGQWRIYNCTNGEINDYKEYSENGELIEHSI
jgi:antitoxin component YwqK of YwqJK toxin-antitoxin module